MPRLVSLGRHPFTDPWGADREPTLVAIEDGWDMDWALPTVIEPYLKNGQAVTVSDQYGHSMQLPEPVAVQPRR